jgi:hypothetical protein
MKKEERRKIFFDTEFIENGRTIDLISIGMVDDVGNTLYLENAECNHAKAGDWVKQNVLSQLQGGALRVPYLQIRHEVFKFCGTRPSFWAYYGAYDWVALCQLFGTMMDLPKGWPYYCSDIKQLCVSVGDPDLPPQLSQEHNALNDAKWTMKAYAFLQTKRSLTK